MIHRLELTELTTLLRSNPVVALLGARQIGKTTMAKLYAKKSRKEVLSQLPKRIRSPYLESVLHLYGHLLA